MRYRRKRSTRRSASSSIWGGRDGGGRRVGVVRKVLAPGARDRADVVVAGSRLGFEPRAGGRQLRERAAGTRARGDCGQGFPRNRQGRFRSRPDRTRSQAASGTGGGRLRAAKLGGRCSGGSPAVADGAAIAVCLHRKSRRDRKSTRLNSSHVEISYAVV